ncbi:hypothetical protein ACFVFQ_36035 [Streptomyces sp. NPDC057743]|uniref:hypothetical protein n=1 Tax=Streptomyces sp. NPDC057743 TaxID=3346236 RepID=UPI00368A8A2A
MPGAFRKAAVMVASVAALTAAGTMPATAQPASHNTPSPALTSRPHDYVANAKRISGTPWDLPRDCTIVTLHGGKVLGQACSRSGRFWVRDLARDGYHVEARAFYMGNTAGDFFDCKDYAGVAGGWTICDFRKHVHHGQRLDFTVDVYAGNTLKKQGLSITPVT